MQAERVSAESPTNATLRLTATDIDLAGTLRDHFNIDVTLGKRRKHLARGADHVPHLPTDKGQDGHVASDGNVSELFQIAHKPVELFLVDEILERHRDVNFRSADEVDDDTGTIERSKDTSKEAVRDGLSIRVNVDDDDRIFDGDGGWQADNLVG